ncbi:flippase [Ignatzschineria ureiclastica]|uniref:Flippase n=1 Tax=Ignatzschineria ureiclastica TaxID=472582 RepID=A0A2U2AHC0_9GAMM|nr:oligosaccharide flippase family protein [Ignatzschineria ureiclastica]PWD82041.1 flippase [Ignatzschineria ureiclastica]GGZ92241.1 polisoprenol-linked O-antigen transporter [Ignatzschineria ureiclastica]
MTRPTSLKRNAFALLTMQAINYLVPLITLPYLTRTLGVDQYGALNLSLSLIQYGMLFINFGFNLSATQYIAQHRDQPQLISKAFWETVLSKSLLFFIACFALTIITLTIESFYEIRWIIFILFIQLLSIAIDPLWFFQGIEKLEKVSFIGSLIRFLNIPLLILFVHTPNDVEIAALIQGGILLIAAIINMIFVQREHIITFVKLHQLKIIQALKHSLPLFIGAAAISLYNTSTPIILGLVSDYDQVGIYSASFRVQVAAIGVFTVLGQVIYPRVNHLFATDIDAAYLFIKKLMIYMFPILLISSLLFYFLVPMLAPRILGEEFKESAETLKIMAPMLFLIPYSVVFAHNLLLPLGYQRIYYLVPLIIGLFHLVYSSFLSHYYGAIGASYSILITEIITLIVLASYVLRHTKIYKLILKNKKRI